MADVKTNLLINGANPVTVGGTGTVIKYFPMAPGANIGVASIKNGILFIPGNAEANAQRLSIRASGNFTIGAGAATSPAVTIGMYPVTFVGGNPASANPSALGLTSTATIGGTPVLSATLAAASDLTGYYPFALNADLCGDSLSGLVQLVSGAVTIDGVGTNASPAVVTGLSGINFSNVAPFGLVMGVTFSVSDSGALANLYQFDCSL